MTLKFLDKKEEKTEKSNLLESINRVKEEIHQNERLFDITLSPDMIDFAIHKDIALKAQFDYLLKRYKELV